MPELEAKESLLTMIAQRSPVALRMTRLYNHPFPFSEDLELIEAYDPAWGPRVRMWMLLHRDGRLWPLDGTSPPIHEVRFNIGLCLSESEALDYLRFFCFFVRGEQGPFLIVESVEQLANACGVRRDDKRLDAFVPHIHEATIEEKHNGSFLANATVHYDDALFETRFEIHSDGYIEMTDDNPLAVQEGLLTNLPVL